MKVRVGVVAPHTYMQIEMYLGFKNNSTQVFHMKRLQHAVRHGKKSHVCARSGVPLPAGQGPVGGQPLHHSHVPGAHPAVPPGHRQRPAGQPAALRPHLRRQSHLGVSAAARLPPTMCDDLQSKKRALSMCIHVSKTLTTGSIASLC